MSVGPNKPQCRNPQPPQHFGLAEVLRAFGPDYLQANKGRLPTAHFQVMRAITRCRTPALGGHLYRCQRCGFEHFVCHACRNRHCPRCQKKNQQQWLQARLKEFLPIGYFHLTFTIPSELNPLFLAHAKEAYALFFKAASRTLLQFGRNNLGVRLGLLALLHTWGGRLNFHPHIHFIVSAGGLSLDETKWLDANPKFLFHRNALQEVFRAKLLALLRRAPWCPKPEPLALKKAQAKTWGIDIRAPRKDPTRLLLYLARYTFRVAIDDKRIREINLQDRSVTFTYRDYRRGRQIHPCTLKASDFIQRFLLHVLPKGVAKIRYYGLFSHSTKKNYSRSAASISSKKPSGVWPCFGPFRPCWRRFVSLNHLKFARAAKKVRCFP